MKGIADLQKEILIQCGVMIDKPRLRAWYNQGCFHLNDDLKPAIKKVIEIKLGLAPRLAKYATEDDQRFLVMQVHRMLEYLKS